MEVTITFLMITYCFRRKHRRSSHISKIAWKPVKFNLYLYANKLFRWSLSLYFFLYAIYALKHFSVYEGSCRNYSPKLFGLFQEAFGKCLK